MANDLINQSYLCNGVSIETQGGCWQVFSFLVGEHVEVGGEWRTWEAMEAPLSFPIPCLMHLFNLAVAKLPPFTINQ